MSEVLKRRPKGNYVDGDMHAVPLFWAEELPEKRFSKKDFAGVKGPFALLRVISNERGGGLLAEVFDTVGSLDDLVESLDDVGVDKRLFRPVAVTSLPIDKGRWPLLREGDGYDKERDSGYSQIQLVVSPRSLPQLWSPATGAQPIRPEQVQQYEPWKVWMPHQLEQRIIKTLEDRGTPIPVG